MNCRLYRDSETGELTRVEAPNGRASTLFKEALSISNNDVDSAMNLWSYAYTDSFKEKFGDWEASPNDFELVNAEPPISKVAKAFQMDNTQEKLSITDKLAAIKFMNRAGVGINELYTTLKRKLFNGKGAFTISRKLLEATNLYTNEEIDNLMNYPSIRGNLLNTLTKIRNTLISEEDTFFQPDENIQEDGLTVTTGKINSLGMMETLPKEEIDTYLIEELSPYTTDTELKNGIQSLGREDIRDAISESPEAMDYVKGLIKSSKLIPVFEYRNGVAYPKSKSNLSETLLNTVEINNFNLNLFDNVATLNNFSSEAWEGNPDAVIEMLKEIEVEAANSGLDLIGLASQYKSKSKEEIMGLLDLVSDFSEALATNTATEDDINDTAEAIDFFFGLSEVYQYDKVDIPSQLKGLNLIKIEDNLNPTELYRVEGFIPVFGNLYQRVQGLNDYQQTLDTTYEALQQDVTILPLEVFEGFGLKNGYYDVNAITNPDNRDKVLASINSYTAKKADAFISEDYNNYTLNREMVLMQAIFNPIQTSVSIDNTVASRASSFKGDASYLMTDFISDFYKNQLNEKLRNSPMWENALKYFKISNTGIGLTTTDPNTIAEIKTILSNSPKLFNNIIQYSTISKDESMAPFRELNTSENIIDTRDTRRDFYVNNPNALNKNTKALNKVSDNTIILKNSTDEFIKTNEGIFELLSNFDGVSVYGKVNVGLNRNFYVFNVSEPINEGIDPSRFRDTSLGYKNENTYSNQDKNKKDLTCNI